MYYYIHWTRYGSLTANIWNLRYVEHSRIQLSSRPMRSDSCWSSTNENAGSLKYFYSVFIPGCCAPASSPSCSWPSSTSRYTVASGSSVLRYYWSSSNEAWLSLVESFIIVLRQQSYAMNNQLGHPKTQRYFLLLVGSLWHKDSRFPWTERIYFSRPYAIKK